MKITESTKSAAAVDIMPLHSRPLPSPPPGSHRSVSTPSAAADIRKLNFCPTVLIGTGYDVAGEALGTGAAPAASDAIRQV